MAKRNAHNKAIQALKGGLGIARTLAEISFC